MSNIERKYFEFTPKFSESACLGSRDTIKLIHRYEHWIFRPYELIKIYRGIGQFYLLPHESRIELFCAHLSDVDPILITLMFDSFDHLIDHEWDPFIPVLDKLAELSMISALS
jgi:hypothetical protein